MTKPLYRTPPKRIVDRLAVDGKDAGIATEDNVA